MSEYQIKSPKKLIEVALPLDDINEASIREKLIQHGNPATLHLWWARRPLASARAVIFAQMVNDPLWHFEIEGKSPSPQEKAAATKKREKLFRIIRELVKWENTTNEKLLNEARDEIKTSWCETCTLNKDHPQADTLFNPNILPSFHDPFAGGGALPLEAQRLGLESYASDLNPVPVMINKAMIEIPPLFANSKPIHPKDKNDWISTGSKTYKGAEGLAEDVAYYGKWIRDEAEKKIGHLYPKIKITQEMTNDRPDLKQYIGDELSIIAYIWARTIKSPNPAFNDVHVPLASTFVLSKKKDKEAWIEPIINGKNYSFKVHIGKYPKEAENGTKTGSKGSNFKCLLSSSPIESNYVHTEFKLKNDSEVLLAIIAEGTRGRTYLDAKYAYNPTEISPNWIPDTEMEQKSSNLISGRGYGIKKWHEIFTKRQLVALSTFSEIISSTEEKIKNDAILSGLEDDSIGIEKLGKGAKAYSQALSVYLSFILDKCAAYWTKICAWHNTKTTIQQTFGRQAIPMIWDFAEVNPFSDSTGNWNSMVNWEVEALKNFAPTSQGFSIQKEA